MREQLTDFGEGQERLWNDATIHTWVSLYAVGTKQPGDHTYKTWVEMR